MNVAKIRKGITSENGSKMRFWLTFRDSETREDACGDEDLLQEPGDRLSFQHMLELSRNEILVAKSIFMLGIQRIYAQHDTHFLTSPPVSMRDRTKKEAIVVKPLLRNHNIVSSRGNSMKKTNSADKAVFDVYWLAIFIYWLAIVFLVGITAFVILRIMSLPVCPKNTICTVDSSSVIAVAGSVLGVAATVLTFLGAFAVAAWWLGLEKQVRHTATKWFEGEKKKLEDALE